MLELKDYKVSYGDSCVIRNLNLKIKKGEIVALLGRNGMGKTTLMKSIIGMIPAQKGECLLDGQDLIHTKSNKRVASGIGFVPQGRMIFSSMSVRENIETGLTVTKSKHIPEDLFETFPILKEFEHRKGGNLSGGQQQQLAIARALASNPKLLVLDEPTEGIQPSIIEDIASAIERVNKELGITILIVEQYLDFVLSISDSYYVMDKGEITLSGLTKEADAKLIQSKMAIG